LPGPSALPWELRLKRSHELLAHTESSLVEIAYACRFSSQSTSTRAFRRHAGVSPGEYRRKAAG
jgi:AraC family transcriptional regulator